MQTDCTSWGCFWLYTEASYCRNYAYQIETRSCSWHHSADAFPLEYVWCNVCTPTNWYLVFSVLKALIVDGKSSICFQTTSNLKNNLCHIFFTKYTMTILGTIWSIKENIIQATFHSSKEARETITGLDMNFSWVFLHELQMDF